MGELYDFLAEVLASARREGADARLALLGKISALAKNLGKDPLQLLVDLLVDVASKVEKLEFDLRNDKAEIKRLEDKVDAATLLLDRAMKPVYRSELIQEALEKLRG